ncbi:MAG: PAS domain-containing protein [Desulfamplus sp.]|nr:PAS domain-containing protein [Desulfamplus sp.]
MKDAQFSFYFLQKKIRSLAACYAVSPAVGNKSGFFKEYKPATVIRRVERRLGIVHAPDLPEYIHYIRQNPTELDILFKDMLIGVTKFFRDQKAFDAFETRVVPAIFEQAQREKRDYIRGWVAGCSTGEEAYSLTIQLHNYMRLHHPSCQIKVFATDIDKDAVEYAGAGFYPDSVVTDIDLKYLSRYFDKKQGGYQVKREIRELVVFAIQNLAKDPPFTKLDFISCRNLLIYLKPQLQKKIFSMFNYVLNPDGYLFLGNSETVGEMTEAFDALDLKNRIFKHTGIGKLSYSSKPPHPFPNRKNVISAAQAAYENRVQRPLASEIFSLDRRESYYHSLLNKSVHALLIIDENRELVQSYGNPGRYLELPLGNITFDVITMLPRELSLAISSAIQKVRKDKKQVFYPAIKIKRSNIMEKVDITVDTVPDYGVRQNLFMVLISENSRMYQPTPAGVTKNFSQGKNSLQGKNSSQEKNFTQEEEASGPNKNILEGDIRESQFQDDSLPMAYTDLDDDQGTFPTIQETLANDRIMDLEREIQFTRENLQATIQELQTANEELQATNEELLAANEEMQSTNEELQSVNEELNTVNAEYQDKVIELTEINEDMNNLMSSSDIATIFLDRTLRVRKFTPAVKELINIMDQDTGRPLTDLDIKIFGNMRSLADKVMMTGTPFEKNIQYDNRWFLQRLIPFFNEKEKIDGVVLNLVDITAQKNIELTLKHQHNQLKSVLEISPAALFTVTSEGKIQYTNRHAEEIMGLKKHRLIKMKIDSPKFNITDLEGNPIPPRETPLALIKKSGKGLENYVLGFMRPDNTRIIVKVTGEPLMEASGKMTGAVFKYEQVAFEKLEQKK